VQTRIGGVGEQEALGEQGDALLAAEAARIKHLQLAREGIAVRLFGIEAQGVDAAPPAADPGRLGPQRQERAVRCGARREDDRGGSVEGPERRPGGGSEPVVLAAQRGVGGQLGVIAGEQRQADYSAEQRRSDAGWPRRGDVQEVVAALGDRLDQVGESRYAEPHPCVEGGLQLRRGRQAAIDAGVGADNIHLKAGHAQLPDSLDRVGDAVHRADPIGDQRHPSRLVLAPRQLCLLGAEEGRRGGVRQGRHQRLEEAPGRRPGIGAADCARSALRRDAQAALVDTTSAPVEAGVGEALGLEIVEQLSPPDRQTHAFEPGLQQAAGVSGAEVGGDLALASGSLGD
jgi:hypothetical protein